MITVMPLTACQEALEPQLNTVNTQRASGCTLTRSYTLAEPSWVASWCLPATPTTVCVIHRLEIVNNLQKLEILFNKTAETQLPTLEGALNSPGVHHHHVQESGVEAFMADSWSIRRAALAGREAIGGNPMALTPVSDLSAN